MPLVSYFGEWLKKPWSEDMDWWQWVLFVVFITTIFVAWLNVLRYITEEV